MPGVTHVPYPNVYRPLFVGPDQGKAVLDYIENVLFQCNVPASEVAAILVEPLQGEGGYLVPPDGFLQGLRELCDRHGIWLLLDEVKAGLGRSGRMWAFEHAGIVADAVSVAKPLGGGLPLSAVVGRRELLEVDLYNLYTLGGTPAPCAAGIATLDVIAKEGLIENAAHVGEYLRAGLRELQKAHDCIGDVRGLGLMTGFELVVDRRSKAPAARLAAGLVYRCFELGLVVIYTGLLANVIEMTPPLTLTEKDVDEALGILDQSLADVSAGRFDEAKLAPYAGW
jgi:4-aminobutyrate aminotransferase